MSTPLSLAQLEAAGRSLVTGGDVLCGDEPLQVLDILRLLPGRRLTARALWRGQPVLAKLFFGRGWQRAWQGECQGALALAAQPLSSPALLARGSEPSGGWVLFDFLRGAVSFGQRWEESPPARRQHQLEVACRLLARLHAAGLWHQDLHWDNLLWQGEQLFLVDAGAVRGRAGLPLSPARAENNLGLLLAQRPPLFLPPLTALLGAYRGEPSAPPVRPARVEARRERWFAWRLRDFLKKTERDCSLFVHRQDWHQRVALVREHAAWLQPLLDDPEDAIARGEPLKLGGSATVARLSVGGRDVIIKRYNLKHALHRARRALRESRAWHSWREGYRLGFLGIATPRPLAVLERRWGPLRGTAYLITEVCPGQDILRRFQDWQGPLPAEDAGQLAALFRALIRHRISHGDFKGSNLFWLDDRYALIDLDAVRQHHGEASFRRAHARDRRRLLRNWPENTEIRRQLERVLPTPLRS